MREKESVEDHDPELEEEDAVRGLSGVVNEKERMHFSG